MAKSTDIRSDWTFLKNLTSQCLETNEIRDLIANKSHGTLLEIWFNCWEYWIYRGVKVQYSPNVI